ncbi:unnamed protein product [Nesidiocoris tenuis]|uniref:EF-hand domain-containing protein n=1 Tax=Nesidiocoris tenuis TaxID=355587 RepID=A0A6H5GI06_9HEMI|nr:unnamed protein product [Nesidiocoris tenuis]
MKSAKNDTSFPKTGSSSIRCEKIAVPSPPKCPAKIFHSFAISPVSGIFFVNEIKSGRLEFEEFVTLAAKFIVEEDDEAMQKELREAFRLYDKEGNGYIPTSCLKEILHELDEQLTNEELEMIIEEIDSDGSGTVDFDEFMEMMTGE